MNNYKRVIFALIVFLLVTALLGFLYKQYGFGFGSIGKNSEPSADNAGANSADQTEKVFMLDDYPLEEVPFFESVSVSSIKFFVNDDPQNFNDYFGQPVNYYNVVFETEATPEELFAYYRSIMDEEHEDKFRPPTQIQGKIGKYKVSASHYGNNPQNYAYLQVYLPSEEYQPENPYYGDYPKVVEIQSNWAEHENSYGLLNQKGGEVEYTQYFSMPENIDEIIAQYQEKYQDQPEYTFNPDTGAMSWKNDKNKIILTFSKDHNRIYLMIRQPMD